MAHHPPHLRVDAVSEAMLALDTDRCPGSIFTALTLRGQPDIDAMARAVRHVQQQFPATVSRLTERREGLRHTLLRVVEPDPPPLELLAIELAGRTVTEALTDHFAARSAVRLDVWSELPASFHLARFADDHHAMVFFFHHVAADGTTMLAMYRALFAAYEEIVTGRRPDWAVGEDIVSSNGRALQTSTRRVFGAMYREGQLRKRHPVLSLGSTQGQTAPHRHLTRFVLDELETAAVARRAKELEATFNDLLCAAAVMAVDAELGSPEGTQSIWVPVNARGATGEASANQTTSINIDLIRKERMDRGTLLRAFIERRRESLAMGRHVVSLRLLEKVVGAARLFPARMRHPWMNALFAQPTTFMVSNLGVVWPQRENGKLTARSTLKHAGGLEIEDFKLNFATFDNTGHEMAAFTFDGRFAAVFSAYDHVVDKARAQRLVASTRGYLLDW